MESLYFIQSDRPNTWMYAQPWQAALICQHDESREHDDPITFTYHNYRYQIMTEWQSQGIPKGRYLVNLDTHTRRRIFVVDFPPHQGAGANESHYLG